MHLLYHCLATSPFRKTGFILLPLPCQRVVVSCINSAAHTATFPNLPVSISEFLAEHSYAADAPVQFQNLMKEELELNSRVLEVWQLEVT